MSEAGWAPPPMRVLRLFRGRTTSSTTLWSACRAVDWTLDYYLHGQQRQRIGDGEPFMRRPGIAALYAPGTRYQEYRHSGEVFEEAWVVFEAAEELAADLRALTGPAGWCHLQDSDGLLLDRLRRLGDLVLQQDPGHRLMIPGLVLELLGLCLGARPAGDQLYTVSVSASAPPGDRDLVARVEHYIEQHLDEPLQVPQLAAHLHMSTSTLAHLYPPLAGETPFQTIVRLKLAAARRLLLRDGLSVTETAARLGFSSAFSFSRTFRRREGISPAHFVQQMRRKS